MFPKFAKIRGGKAGHSLNSVRLAIGKMDCTLNSCSQSRDLKSADRSCFQTDSTRLEMTRFGCNGKECVLQVEKEQKCTSCLIVTLWLLGD